MATTPHLINARQFVEGIKRPGFKAFTRLPDALGTAGLATDCTELAALINTDDSIYSQLGAVLGVLESALSDCSKQITALNAQCLAEQNRAKDLQDLANTLPSRLTSAAAPAPSMRRITKDPEKFSRSEKDITKRQQSYVNWRSQITACLVIDSAVFDTELRRINHIASLLTGDAYNMNRTAFDTVTNLPDKPHLWHWRTAAHVFTQLDSQYETLDLSRQASIQFDLLTMGNRPFQNFVAELNMYASQCGKTPEQKVEALRVKVSQELSTAVTFKSNKPDKFAFDEWAKLYQEIYHDIQEQAHFDRLRTGKAPYRSQQRSPETTYFPSDPMQVDSISRLTNRPSREECVERSLCFYCKKPGHVADHCFQSKASEAWPRSPYRPSPRQVQRPPQPRFVDQRPQQVQTYQHRNLSPPATQ